MRRRSTRCVCRAASIRVNCDSASQATLAVTCGNVFKARWRWGESNPRIRKSFSLVRTHCPRSEVFFDLPLTTFHGPWRPETRALAPFPRPHGGLFVIARPNAWSGDRGLDSGAAAGRRLTI